MKSAEHVNLMNISNHIFDTTGILRLESRATIHDNPTIVQVNSPYRLPSSVFDLKGSRLSCLISCFIEVILPTPP